VERATSFGSIAEDYDRLRPGPPAAALDWLIPAQCRIAVDLAAGTGLFTRALHERVPEVVAVEPDDRMRAVLEQRSPDVRAVAGRGEDIPLPDSSVDAVFVSSAWHWFDKTRAVPEIARVLRPGGRLGVIWTSRDRTVDWVRTLDRLRGADYVATNVELDQRDRRRHEFSLPDTDRFDPVERESFATVRSMRLDDVIEWLGTYSEVIIAAPEERAQHLNRVRSELLERFGDVATIDVPLRAECWRVSRR
jgi:ubiquinone/menaquinone biosynthesis C-methylase UbiE